MGRYAITLTLKPKGFSVDADTQYDRTFRVAVGLCLGISLNITLVAELTKQYNVHYHGVIELDDSDGYRVKQTMKKFVDTFRNHDQLGFVNIKPVTDMDEWIKYITKDLQGTQDLIERAPILIDRLELLPVQPLEIRVQDQEEYNITTLKRRGKGRILIFDQ